jgi:hypothetical protein
MQINSGTILLKNVYNVMRLVLNAMDLRTLIVFNVMKLLIYKLLHLNASTASTDYFHPMIHKAA